MLTKHDLVPLELAARAVYRRVYEAQHLRAGLSFGPEQLDGIAHAIAARAPLYTYEEVGSGVRLLQGDELAGGLFREGGRSMVFPDGRPRLERLAVASSGVDQVCAALAGQRDG